MRNQAALLQAHFKKNSFAKEVYDNILNYTPEQIDELESTKCRKWVKKLLKKHLGKVKAELAAHPERLPGMLSPEEIAAMMPTNDVEEMFDVYRYQGDTILYRVTEKTSIDITNGDYILITSGGIKVNQHFALGRPDQYTLQLIRRCESIGKMTAPDYSTLAGKWVVEKPHGAMDTQGASYEEAIARVEQRIANSIKIG